MEFVLHPGITDLLQSPYELFYTKLSWFKFLTISGDLVTLCGTQFCY